MTPILTAGVAALVGGAISMALGEYVSVSSQRDSQRALIAKEQRELVEMPQEELAELTQLYVDKGLTPPTARQVAHELTANNALAAVTAGRSAAQLHVGRIEPEAAGELAAGLRQALGNLGWLEQELTSRARELAREGGGR